MRRGHWRPRHQRRYALPSFVFFLRFTECCAHWWYVICDEKVDCAGHGLRGLFSPTRQSPSGPVTVIGHPVCTNLLRPLPPAHVDLFLTTISSLVTLYSSALFWFRISRLRGERRCLVRLL